MPLRPKSPIESRDCPDCKTIDGMKLQNVARTSPVNIPLLYICQQCGTMFTVPPPEPVTR